MTKAARDADALSSLVASSHGKQIDEGFEASTAHLYVDCSSGSSGNGGGREKISALTREVSQRTK